MVYMDKILRFINTLIIIYYKVYFWNMLELGDYASGMQPKYQMNVFVSITMLSIFFIIKYIYFSALWYIILCIVKYFQRE